MKCAACGAGLWSAARVTFQLGAAQVFYQLKQLREFGSLVKEVVDAVLATNATENFGGIIAANDFQRIRDFCFFGNLAQQVDAIAFFELDINDCLLYTSPSPRDVEESRMPSSA